MKGDENMVFVDAENVSKKLVKKFYEKHQTEQYRVYGKKANMSNIYSKIKNVKFIYCLTEKNSADMFMTTDIVKSLYEEDINIYYLLTQDNDFSIAIKTITEKKKEVVIVSSLGRQLQNLKKIGTDLDYVEFQQIDEDASNVITVTITNQNKTIYNMCKDRVWIKTVKNNIIEMPFSNGMPLVRAIRFLSDYRKELGVGSSLSWENLIEQNYLHVKNNKIYYLDEEQLSEKT
jgi:hypothetical protein